MKKLLIISALFFLALIFSPGTALAQGTFDCNWRDIAGRKVCRATNISCEKGYTADFDFCGQKTPSGEAVCENFKSVSCVKEAGSGSYCAGVSSGKTGTCYSATLCPEGTIEDGQYPKVCESGGRCCVSTPEGKGPLGGGECSSLEIDTAIGCIPTANMNLFIAFILRWAIGIGGGIAFLLIVFAGFQIMTSAGNPERLKAGQELLTSAIAGLILLIFSVFILKIIGVDILKLPGLK